ncbi:MOP flippase family protein [Marinobacter sp. M-5]|uniref:MOP flippase family protein n=1 Tax=Marinobacter sp. M-5 TaxID=3081089 RepID=UPI00293CADCE|nr:MOP flippase family protein [Marinobacter sp. M-5]MDV3503091.1 MOP flippase family protein [Marinobacter sp. M-5]
MSEIISGAKWVAFETIFSRVLQLISALFVARILGPEVMGTVAIIWVALEIFRLFSEMGITQALVHYKHPTSEQLATLYSFNWILAAASYFLICLSAPLVATFFEREQLVDLISVAGLTVLISAVGQQVFALLQKELKFKVMSLISMVSAAINVFVAISLVSLGWGIWSIVISQLAAVIIRNGLAFIYGLQKNLLNGFGLSFKSVIPMLSFGLYQTAAMSMNLINSRADQIIIGKTMGTTALGVYSIGSQITLQTMQQINSVATRVAFPAVSKRQNDLDEVKDIYLTMIANVLLVSAPLFIGLAAVSPVFVNVLLGDKWTNLSSVLSILCGYVLLRSLGNMNSPLVMGLGKANWSFYWNFFLLFIIPAVVFFSSLAGSIEMVAFAMLLTQFVLLIVAYFFWVRRLIGPCAKEYFGTIVKPLLSSGVMGVGVAAIYEFFTWEQNILTLIILVVSGIFFYFIVSFVLNGKNLRNFIRNFIVSVGSKA